MILKELEAALLTDAELAEGEASWKEFEDIFFGGEYFATSSDQRDVNKERRAQEQKHGDDASADCRVSLMCRDIS